MATSISTEYRGQIVPATPAAPLSKKALKTAKSSRLQLFVASENKLKVEAAKNAVMQWLGLTDVVTKGFNAASKIKEQPVGIDKTARGAHNRISHLKELAKGDVKEDSAQLYVSMENGIMPEEVALLKNKNQFYDPKRKKTWVDRCYVIVQLFYKGKESEGTAISRGITVPLDAVKAAKKAHWDKTAGSFIEQIYGYNSKDWHGRMAGVGRQVLMEETIRNALGTK